jgi:predicted permease
VLWVLMPFIVFFNVGTIEFDASVTGGIGFGYVALAVTVLAAFLVGTYVLRLPRSGVGALMCAATFANTAYLGLPFAAVLLGFDAIPNAVAYDTLVSSIALVTIGFSIGAAFGTVAEGARDRLLAFITRNPPLWATVLGLLAPAALTPEWAIDASRVVVVTILPIGFFAVGVTLAAEAEEGTTRFPPPITAPVAWAVVLKLALPPLVLLGLSRLIVDVPDAYFSQAAMATGINNLVIAHAYGLDRALVAAAIVWTTALVAAGGLVLALL